MPFSGHPGIFFHEFEALHHVHRYVQDRVHHYRVNRFMQLVGLPGRPQVSALHNQAESQKIVKEKFLIILRPVISHFSQVV